MFPGPRSEDPVDPSKSATGKKRPSKERSRKRKAGRAGAITEGPRKERERKVTDAPGGRGPRKATRGIWTDATPSAATLAPQRERPKKGKGTGASARASRTPLRSRSGQGLDAPSPSLLEKIILPGEEEERKQETRRGRASLRLRRVHRAPAHGTLVAKSQTRMGRE